ncbi:transcriptional regulator, AraC family [Phaeobacter inhibens]|uniref:Transcriptional regulator, AraC family n=2 Tax=Phaeobacter inhibens TaxID=221822 RepID=A0A2I7KAL4_9RHOB|nr:transcriptional regulator, AraC family [Phaeobacter inhibens]
MMHHLEQSDFRDPAPVRRAVRAIATTPGYTARVGLYVFSGFPMEEYALFASALHDAGDTCGQSLKVNVLSSNGGFVQGSCSAAVKTSPLADALRELDYLVIFGGHKFSVGRNQHFRAALQLLRRSGCQVAAVGGAALTLAKDGVFESSRCAVHWQNRELFNGLMSTLAPTDQVCAVNDGDWSSCGKTGALDLALHVVTEVYGKPTATRLAQTFIHTRLSDPHSTQTGEVLHAAVSGSALVNEAITLFQRHLENPLPMAEVSRILGSPSRRIERHFKQHCGTTPCTYYRQMRLDHARRLLLRTNMTLIDVAIAAGFSTSASFASAFQQVYGTTPNALRKSLNGAKAGQKS